MPDFGPVIETAYQEILGRPADATGLAHYDREMNLGMREARMREALLRSLEYAENNPGKSAFAERVGMNVHLPSNAILSDVALGLGVFWLRVDFDWFRIEPEQGRFEWAETDRVVETAWRNGQAVLATIAYTPGWASSNPDDPGMADPPTSTARWIEIVRRSLERYRDRVSFWQLWNEPNLPEFWKGSSRQYRTEILEPGAETIRQLDPNCRVVGPGLANVGSWRDWFEETMVAKRYLDVINHHNYAATGRASIVELRTDTLFRPSLRTLIRENGVDDRPFWLTETGRRTMDGDQPRYYEDILQTLESETWVDRLFFFHYWDGPAQGNGGFGIVNQDLSPKPAYFVLQSFLNRVARAKTNEAT